MHLSVIKYMMKHNNENKNRLRYYVIVLLLRDNCRQPEVDETTTMTGVRQQQSEVFNYHMGHSVTV